MTFIRADAGFIARQHDTTHSPVGLWQLDGDLTDSSGSGYTLTVENGTERYSNLPGGKIQGAIFDGSTNLIYNVAEATLRILGDMTIECLIEWLDASPGISPNSNTRIASHVGTGGSGNSVDNQLFSFGPASGAPGFRYFAEFGSGSNIDFSTTDSAPQSLQHLAMVRESNDITYYVNGQAISPSSSGLSAPTDGSSGRFRIGANNALLVPVVAVVATVKLVASALTAQEIANEYGRTLG